MKVRLLFLAMLFAGKFLRAQNNQPSLSENASRPYKLEGLYLNLGIGSTLIPKAGAPVSGRITALLANGWGGSAGIRGSNMANQNAPSSSHRTVVKGFAIFGIKDGFSVIDLCAARKSWLRGTRKPTRFGVAAGGAIVNTTIHTYTLLSQYYNDPVPTYLAEPVYETTIGLQAAVNIAFVPTRVFGGEICLWGNLNKLQPIVGLEVNVLLGWLRSKGQNRE